MVSSLLPPPPPLLLPLSPPHAATSSAMATRQPEAAVQRPRKVPPRRYGYNVRASYARRLTDRNGRTGAVAPCNYGQVYSRRLRTFRCSAHLSVRGDRAAQVKGAGSVSCSAPLRLLGRKGRTACTVAAIT